MDISRHLILFFILVFTMVEDMSQMNFITLLVKGFVVLLWVGIAGIGFGVGISIGISWWPNIIGHIF